MPNPRLLQQNVVKTLASLLLSFCLSCGPAPENKQPTLHGRWKMVYNLADIGDGNATWRQADMNDPRIITFTEKGEFIDNKTGRSQKFEFQDSTHLNVFSDHGAAPFTFTIVKLTGDSLELRPNCIEACGEKFVRLN
jgi:hypothetical protein